MERRLQNQLSQHVERRLHIEADKQEAEVRIAKSSFRHRIMDIVLAPRAPASVFNRSKDTEELYSMPLSKLYFSPPLGLAGYVCPRVYHFSRWLSIYNDSHWVVASLAEGN